MPIYATGSEGDLLYFAMPYLSGASLGQVIKTARSHELVGQRPVQLVVRGAGSGGALARANRPRSQPGASRGRPVAGPDRPGADSHHRCLASGTHHLSKAYIRTAVQVMAAVAEGLHHAHEAASFTAT